MITWAAFTRAGSRDGTDLYHHDCPRFGVAYLCERPSHPEAEHLVPGCGCRPDPATSGTDVPRWMPAVRTSTVSRILEAGFTLPGMPADGDCQCGHPFGPHELAATFGSPLDGGLYRCQEPECECTGTWSTSASGRDAQ